MLKTIHHLWNRWRTEPKISQKIFIFGLIPFFVGFVILYIITNPNSLQADIGRACLYGGIFISAVGYIGIWKWRLKDFMDK